MVKPRILFILHLHEAIEKITNRSMRNSKTMAQNRPLLLTGIGCSALMRENRSQGTGRPTVISNMLLPTELDTAMSPRPFRATITLVMRSGIEVPAARIVKPIISSEIPMVSPAW